MKYFPNAHCIICFFNRLKFAVIACSLILCISSAHAEIPANKYTEFKKNVPQFKDYLIGLGRGIFWANTLIEMQGKPKLFCMPENLSLDDGLILSIIDQEIKKPSIKKPWGNGDTVEMVAAIAFVNRFPCPE